MLARDTLHRCSAANIRYWLSAGRGGFALSASECIRNAFYVMVYTPEPVSPTRHLEGFKASPWLTRLPARPSGNVCCAHGRGRAPWWLLTLFRRHLDVFSLPLAFAQPMLLMLHTVSMACQRQ